MSEAIQSKRSQLQSSEGMSIGWSIVAALVPVFGIGVLVAIDSGGPVPRALLSLSAVLLLVLFALPPNARRQKFHKLSPSIQIRLFIALLLLVAAVFSIEFLL